MRRVVVRYTDDEQDVFHDCEVQEVCSEKGEALCYVVSGQGWKTTIRAATVKSVEEVE